MKWSLTDYQWKRYFYIIIYLFKIQLGEILRLAEQPRVTGTERQLVSDLSKALLRLHYLLTWLRAFPHYRDFISILYLYLHLGSASLRPCQTHSRIFTQWKWIQFSHIPLQLPQFSIRGIINKSVAPLAQWITYWIANPRDGVQTPLKLINNFLPFPIFFKVIFIYLIIMMSDRDIIY